MLECAVKQGVQFLWGNSLSVIGYRKAGIISPCTERQLDFSGCLAVNHGIFHEVGQDLLNQNGIHRYDQQFVWNGNGDGDRWKVAVKFLYSLPQNLLGSFWDRGDMGLMIPHTGDREQIFHHTDQPLGLVADILQQLMLLCER